MRKSYVKVSAFMAIMILALTGCGSEFPDMTQEEEQLVGEYAAKLLLKYDANNRSRLVSREDVEAYESEVQQKPQIVIPEQPEMEPIEDTPVIEIGQETDSIGTTGTFEEFYELAEGIKILYQGNEVCNSYPKDGSASDYFALDAEAGNKLLVLKFGIENHSQTESDVDFLSKVGSIRATINGSNDYNVLTTMLMDDMSTYKGTVPAGESVNAVLLVEVKEEVAEEISTVSLNLKNDSKTCTIELQ